MSAVAVGINKGFISKPVTVGATGIDIVVRHIRIFNSIPHFIYCGIGTNDYAVARAVDCVGIVFRKTNFALRAFGIVVESLLKCVVKTGLSRTLEECACVNYVHAFF